MKQVIQNFNTGFTGLIDTPCPRVDAGQLLIRTENSLISTGTERMLIEFGRSNLLQKARQQPDKVRLVCDKVRTDGIVQTWEALKEKLDQPIPLGYCNVGVVSALGQGVSEFSLGERVVSNGSHAEMVSVAKNLCARIPENVSNEAAAFTVVGAIALQGIRLIKPTLGETIAVIGLGLIGQLSVQILKANGCNVIAADYDREKIKIAKNFGAKVIDLNEEDPVEIVDKISKNIGIDAVLITASTESDTLIHQAAQICRQRGRIVLVGVVGLKLQRNDFYKKEISFQVSSSYGPGRYDPSYEEKGVDYPIGFVRWTEQRNFTAILDLMSKGSIDVLPLITNRFKLDNIENAYEAVTNSKTAMGILIEYSSNLKKEDASINSRSVYLNRISPKKSKVNNPTISVIGAGNYATSQLIPAMKMAGASLSQIATNGGIKGIYAAMKYGFDVATTDIDLMFEEKGSSAIVIATRHDSHANLVIKAIECGKHVYVEKPLCLTLEELAKIKNSFYSKRDDGLEPILMVGFNRRFAPHVRKIKELLNGISEPKSFLLTVNAGYLPNDHWAHNSNIGGGRIIGEACHFVDLLRHLAGHKIIKSSINRLSENAEDTATIQLSFEDGSMGTIHYFANGNKKFPKERLEVFVLGRILQLDNFRRLRGYGWKNFKNLNLWRQDKGQKTCANEFMKSISNGTESPISIEEIFEVSKIIIELAQKN
ncbi:bi-domain-containing oxidoreductase [Polynucleobacter sp. AP-Ainpum-60-G11]|uniref:bi-domain-containing oxidoreductase n=1 Tax=Polynucleobacter sp. AP-Ainpum-60-G11 TaxID=2576926 RepID=UPI001BFD8E07|nr:bi-domain-containing oxidoreductase [Polynucleobacter sp. AP-Ainpum-60-G11]QWE27027.1 bi-domain-containing oxidoreductase [Polynucleobacter sp. AP-Ainpum-60-G11]